MARVNESKPLVTTGDLARRERRFVLSFALFLASLATFFSIAFIVLAQQYLLGTVYGVFAAMLFTTPRAVRQGRELRPVAHLVTAATIILLMSASTAGNGASGTTLGFLALAVFLAVYLLGPRAGALWTTVACGGVAFMAVLAQTYDFTPRLDGPALAFNNAGVIAIGLAIALVLARHYHNKRRAQLAALREATQTRRLLSELSALGGDVQNAAVDVAGEGGLTARLGAAAYRVQDTHQQVASRANQLLDSYQLFGTELVGVRDQMSNIHQIVEATDAVDERLALAALNAALQAGKTGVVAFRLIANEVGRVSADALALVNDIKRDSGAVERRLQEVVALAEEAAATAATSRRELGELSRVLRQLVGQAGVVQDEAAGLRDATQARLELLVSNLSAGDAPAAPQPKKVNRWRFIRRYVDWAVAPVVDHDDRLRARLIVTFCLGLAAIVLSIVPILVKTSPAGAVLLSVTAAAMLLWPFVLHRTHSLVAAASGVCAGYIVLVTASSKLSGGINGVTLPALLIVPFAAVFWMGQRKALGWTLVAGLVPFVFATLDSVGVRVETAAIPEALVLYINPASIMGNLWLCWLLASAHVHHSNSLESQLASLEDLQDAANQVGELADDVRKKLARFTGDDGSATGLTRQVERAVEHARTAEAKLESVNDSIAAIDEQIERLVSDAGSFAQYALRLQKIRRRLEVVSLEASLQAVSQKDSRLVVVADELRAVIAQSGAELSQVDEASAQLRRNLRHINVPEELREQASFSLGVLHAGTDQLDAMTGMSRELELLGQTFVTKTERHLDAVGAVMDSTMEKLHRVLQEQRDATDSVPSRARSGQ